MQATWTGPFLLYVLQQIVLAHLRLSGLWRHACTGLRALLERVLSEIRQTRFQVARHNGKGARKPQTANRVAVVIQNVSSYSGGLDDLTYLLLWYVPSADVTEHQAVLF